MAREGKDGRRREFDLTEPVIIPCIFITGGSWEISQGSVRLVGWTEMPDLGDLQKEKRISVRIAMTRRTAREIAGPLLDGLGDDDN